MALYYAGIQVDIVEVALKEKPAEMLSLSAKGTVPVLQLMDDRVLDESLEIMTWALHQHDPDHWLPNKAGSGAKATLCHELVAENDSTFKRALDRYKYPQRYPNEDCSNARNDGLAFLTTLNTRLTAQPYLFGETVGYADIAIFPFVRQFANVDFDWFQMSPLKGLQTWLDERVNSPLFKTIMEKNRQQLLD